MYNALNATAVDQLQGQKAQEEISRLQLAIDQERKLRHETSQEEKARLDRELAQMRSQLKEEKRRQQHQYEQEALQRAQAHKLALEEIQRNMEAQLHSTRL